VSDEVVALYDPTDVRGRVTGTAPRSRVRRENLPHAATGVVIRRPDSRVLVHRRSAAKDLWPGLLDCASGGVVLAGETPERAARRELAEEVGIDDPGLRLEPLLRDWYHDDVTWHLASVYRALWDGPVRFLDGEVAEAWWEAPDAVAAALADPASPFVPDTRALLTRLDPGAVFGVG
jgi:8-oxo-dGTP pyrophosphatase MutT (NUDIX family)